MIRWLFQPVDIGWLFLVQLVGGAVGLGLGVLIFGRRRHD